MMRVQTLKALSVGAALALFSGCYGYVPASSADLQPGVNVRARVSADAAERLQESIGDEDRELRGEVVAAGADEVTLSVQTAAVHRRASVRSFHQRVTVPRRDVQQVEVRELDPWRTAGAAGVIGAAIGYLVVQQFESQGVPNGEGDRSSTDQIVVPLLHWAPKR